MLQNFLEFIFVQARYFSSLFFSSYYFHLSPSIKIWSIQENEVKILSEGRPNSGDKSPSSKMKTKLSFSPPLPSKDPQFHHPAAVGREGVQLDSSLFHYRCSPGAYQLARYLCPYYSRHLWIHWWAFSWFVRWSCLSHFRKSSSSLIRVCLHVSERLLPCFFPTGASAAAMLIFILPSAFYIKLVKKEPMKSVQKIGVCIDKYVTTLAY